MNRRFGYAGEWVIERIIQLAGITAIVLVLMILAFLLRNSLPIFAERSLADLLQGERWSPTAGDGHFGLLPLILGSLYVTLGALALSVPLGLACAIFIAEVCPAGAKEYLKPAVEMLAAIPSVVYGFLGLLLIGPWLADSLNLPVGRFAALGSLILAFMAIPTIVSVSEDALRSVPAQIRSSSLALGATRWQTISRAVLPSARSGVIAAVLLGMGRSIGETMTVLMVTGNAAVMPEGIAGMLRPIRTMTATIAAEMGETAVGSAHYHALFMIGLMLLIITFITNTIADVVVRNASRMQS